MAVGFSLGPLIILVGTSIVIHSHLGASCESYNPSWGFVSQIFFGGTSTAYRLLLPKDWTHPVPSVSFQAWPTASPPNVSSGHGCTPPIPATGASPWHRSWQSMDSPDSASVLKCTPAAPGCESCRWIHWSYGGENTFVGLSRLRSPYAVNWLTVFSICRMAKKARIIVNMWLRIANNAWYNEASDDS